MNFLILLIVVSFSYIEIGLLLPVVFPLVMEGTLVPEAWRGLFMGCLIGGAATAKFFALPLLGAWSDRVGRKKVLMITLLILFLGEFCGLIALQFKMMPFLLLSRVLVGIGAGSYAVAQATIADDSKPSEKTKRFALLNSSCGAGYVLGPLLGRVTVVSPFTMALGLGLVNLFLVMLLFRPPPVQVVRASNRICRFTALRLPHLRSFFLMILLFCLGWGFFCECLPLFLMNHFKFGSKEIGTFYLVSGLMITFCQGVAVRPFANRFSPQKLLVGGLVALLCSVPLLLAIHAVWLFYLLLGPIVLFQALVFPSAATLISNQIEPQEQGEVLGTYQSLQAAGMALGPLLLSSLIAFVPALPILMGALAPAIALAFSAKIKYAPGIKSFFQ